MSENIFVGMKNGVPIFCDEDHYYEMTHTSFAKMNGCINEPFHSGTNGNKNVFINAGKQKYENSSNGK
jgi:hypothetical protein